MGILVYKTHLEKQENGCAVVPPQLWDGDTIQLGFAQILTKKCCFLFVCHTFSLGVRQDAAISSLCCRGLKDVAASVWQCENGKKVADCSLRRHHNEQRIDQTHFGPHTPSFFSCRLISLSLSPRLLYNISLLFFLSLPSLAPLHQVWVNTKRRHRRRCCLPET